jgi:transposase-like protein
MTRPRRPRCLCLHPGFDLVAPADDGRPQFRCQRCGRTWTCGKDGGPYLAAAKKPRAVR